MHAGIAAKSQFLSSPLVGDRVELFFFQAEGGIRYLTVTGVQTCALPICSFFWPAVLILVGILALLVNTGRIPIDRLLQLADLWPVILIVIGLEIIIRRSVHGPKIGRASCRERV